MVELMTSSPDAHLLKRAAAPRIRTARFSALQDWLVKFEAEDRPIIAPELLRVPQSLDDPRLRQLSNRVAHVVHRKIKHESQTGHRIPFPRG